MPGTRDHEIKQDVLRELAWDSRITDTEVGVTVRDAVVTLTGSVDSYAKKLAAQEAAHRVRNVLDVANDLVVRPPGDRARPDPEIASAVRRALEWDALVPHEDIRSTVSGGWVTLEGSVRYLREKHDAEEAIRRLQGVHGVQNRIEVRGSDLETDRMRRAIEDALERRARREARHIRIEVKNGTVTLSGKVDSWSEKQALLGLVGHTAGVREVQDELEIDPYGGRS